MISDAESKESTHFNGIKIKSITGGLEGIHSREAYGKIK